MASSDKVWHYEQVKIKDSEYAKKCGIGGDCYFYVSKGQIKISQLDNKTSLDLAISRIRTWGASSTTFFLELGSRSPAGEGRLEMTHKVRILHITCWLHINEMTEPKRLASDGTRDDK